MVNLRLISDIIILIIFCLIGLLVGGLINNYKKEKNNKERKVK